MAAYWIARARITDPETYKKYTDLVPDIIARYRGKVLARGGAYRMMAGPDNFGRHVVIEFPTFADAVACFESPEYQAASVNRIAGGVVETVIVAGADATPAADPPQSANRP